MNIVGADAHEHSEIERGRRISDTQRDKPTFLFATRVGSIKIKKIGRFSLNVGQDPNRKSLYMAIYTYVNRSVWQAFKNFFFLICFDLVSYACR